MTYDWKSKDGLRKIAAQARNLLENYTGADAGDMDGVCDHLSSLIPMLALIAQGKATTLVLKRKAEMEVISRMDGDLMKRLSATMLKSYVEGKCAEETGLHEMFCSLEREFGTAVDAYRTIVSFRKAEMEKFQNT